MNIYIFLILNFLKFWFKVELKYLELCRYNRIFCFGEESGVGLLGVRSKKE